MPCPHGIPAHTSCPSCIVEAVANLRSPANFKSPEGPVARTYYLIKAKFRGWEQPRYLTVGGEPIQLEEHQIDAYLSYLRSGEGLPNDLFEAYGSTWQEKFEHAWAVRVEDPGLQTPVARLLTDELRVKILGSVELLADYAYAFGEGLPLAAAHRHLSAMTDEQLVEVCKKSGAVPVKIVEELRKLGLLGEED